MSGTEVSGGEQPSIEEALARPVRRIFLLSLLPLFGLVLFGVGAGLAMRAFSQNNSFSCDVSCSHYSYALPIAVGFSSGSWC